MSGHTPGPLGAHWLGRNGAWPRRASVLTTAASTHLRVLPMVRRGMCLPATGCAAGSARRSAAPCKSGGLTEGVQTMDTQFWNEGQHPDPRPGAYYVSASQGEKYWLMRGPFTLHVDALRAVRETMEKARDMDARAHFMAWGTCRKPADLVRADPGKMNSLFEARL